MTFALSGIGFGEISIHWVFFFAFQCCRSSFFCCHRAATSSQSSVKLDALVRDLDTTLLHDPAAKFVIFSQYPQVHPFVNDLIGIGWA